MTVQDQAVSWVVRRNSYRNPIPEDDADVEFTHSAGKLGSNGLSARKLDSEIPTGEHVGDFTFNLCKIVACHRLPASATAVVVTIAATSAAEAAFATAASATESTAASAASTTESAATAAESTTSAFTRLHWTSFVHDHSEPAVVSAVELADCVSCFFVSRELDETEALGTASFTVHDDLSRHYFSDLREDLVEIMIGSRERQLTNKKFLTHKSSFDFY
jgi:hypothetical protein